jgi:uncharacterized DUF497 family protein
LTVSPSFEWDPAKDAQNQRKHGVAFVDAQLAFLDPARVIAKDLSHSKGEPRFYCFGEAVEVSWPYGSHTAVTWFGFLVPVIGAEARRSMKRNRKYRDEPLGRLEVVKDFLPPPDQLVLRDEGVKVTISLSKRSVNFFKRHAARSKVPYQKMIRSLLDTYAKHHGADL